MIVKLLWATIISTHLKWLKLLPRVWCLYLAFIHFWLMSFRKGKPFWGFLTKAGVYWNQRQKLGKRENHKIVSGWGCKTLSSSTMKTKHVTEKNIYFTISWRMTSLSMMPLSFDSQRVPCPIKMWYWWDLLENFPISKSALTLCRILKIRGL